MYHLGPDTTNYDHHLHHHHQIQTLGGTQYTYTNSKQLFLGHSKVGRSESDTDSISESSTVPRHKKSRHHGEKKKRSHSHSRTSSVPVSLTENEEVTEYVPTFDGNKSLYVPTHRLPSSKRNSDSELSEGTSSSTVPRLKRTTSLKTDGPKRRPERKSIGIFEECLENDTFLEKDFYDILAEKYGIRNVKRYDLGPTESQNDVRRRNETQKGESEVSENRNENRGRKSNENRENRRSLISLTEIDQKEKLPKTKLSNSEQCLNEIEDEKKGKKEKDILPPLPPKPKKEEFKNPSEKLAAVLNRLESNYEKTEKKPEARGIPNDLLYGKKETKPAKSRGSSVAKETPKTEIRKIESERLAELSPKALELYEKTLGLYQKTLAKKIDKPAEVEEAPKKVPEIIKPIAVKKSMTRHNSDMSLRDYEKYDVPTKEMLIHPEKFGKVRETPEKSVLSKYFHYGSCEDGLKNTDQYFKDKKLKHYASLQTKLDEDVGNKSDIEVTVTMKLPKDKSPEKRKSVKRLSSPEKRKSVKGPKDEEEKKRAVRIKRLSKDLENELNKMEAEKEKEKEAEEVWKKREDVEEPKKAEELKKEEPPKEIKKEELPKEIKKSEPIKEPEPIKKEKSQNKFLSSLEKKFEKFRTPSDKNYVDKAIRSLRESSLGPKDVACENVLIKRAVSLSDCSIVKPVQPSRIQSTVNSVLGIFKKFESPDAKKKSTENLDMNRRSSIPTLQNYKKTEEIDKKPSGEPSTSIPQKQIPKIIADNQNSENPENGNPSRRQSCISACGNDLSVNKSSSMILGMDDSSSFLSPDSESFDSWSNCSDFGTPDEFVPNLRTISPILKLANLDDVVGESVGDRIRRKSFYTRFNERKKPRKSAILDGRKKYDQAVYDEAQKESQKQHSYNRTLSQNLDKARIQQPYSRSLSSADYTRPRPFYKVGSKSPTNENLTPYRKTSLDSSKYLTSPNFGRSVSQSSSGSNYSTTNPALTKNYLGSYDNIRMRRPESVYSPRSADLERAFSPVRTFSPTNRTLSPTFGFRRSPSTSALD